MTVSWPELGKYPRVGFDTETTGLTRHDRPVGCSVSTPDRQSWYFSWGAGDPQGRAGPTDMNNCSLEQFQRWAAVELNYADTIYVGHNIPFDLRMLAYQGTGMGPRVEDTQIIATLLNENRHSFALNDLAFECGVGSKDDQKLLDYCARHFGGKPTRKQQGKNFWRVPYEHMHEYAEHDPVLTLAVYDVMRPQLDALPSVTKIYLMECQLARVLLKMHLLGTRVDVPRARRLKEELLHEKVALEKSWHDQFGDVNYASGLQMKPILDKLGIPYGLTAKTKVPQITADWLASIEHPLGAHIRSMRQIDHYSGTFIENYVLANCGDGDIVHPEFHALKGDEYGTITGRLSSGGEMNAQNVPARDELWAPRIRSLYRPMRDDQRWAKFDYSQIEYRFFAHFAGEFGRACDPAYQSAMEQAYIDNPEIDFHTWVAETTGIPRKRAKNVNFCKLYGGGAKKVAATAGITLEEALEFYRVYEAKIPESKTLADEITKLANRRGYITTWGGRRCRFLTNGQEAARYNRQPDGKSSGNAFARTYRALNKLLQGSAADLIKEAMIAIDRAIDWDDVMMHLTVHDELDFSVEESKVDRTSRDVCEIMSAVSKTPSWTGSVMRVPVKAEVDIGKNWGMTE